jgi:D-aspartate ligase
MVQEMISGGGENQFSYAGLHIEGRPIPSLVARRSRQFPADFGRASSFVETIDHPEIERTAKLLVETMGYTGIAEVEFKYDPAIKPTNFSTSVLAFGPGIRWAAEPV